MKKRAELKRSPQITKKILNYIKHFDPNCSLVKYMRVDKNLGDGKVITKKKGTILVEMKNVDEMASSGCMPLTTSTTESSSTAESFDMRHHVVDDAAEIRRRIEVPTNKKGILKKSNLSQSVVLLPVEIENAPTKENQARYASAENMHTPVKQILVDRSSQTPETTQKSHKRLEWDSLADIGYRRDISSSSITSLERKMLKQFFCESLSESLSPAESNSAEKVNESKCDSNFKRQTPLASSTMLDREPNALRSKMTNRQMEKEVCSKATSTHSQDVTDKSAQTGTYKKQQSTASPSVQVNESSSVLASNIGSSTTPSSFEYHEVLLSTKSSKNSFPVGTAQDYIEYVKNKLAHNLVASGQSRPALSTTENYTSKTDTSENKENQEPENAALSPATTNDFENNSAKSLPRNDSPNELDLGIKLLCKLVNVKSLDNERRRQLIEDVVKRVTALENTKYLYGTCNGTKKLKPAIKAGKCSSNTDSPSVQLTESAKSSLTRFSLAESQKSTGDSEKLERLIQDSSMARAPSKAPRHNKLSKKIEITENGNGNKNVRKDKDVSPKRREDTVEDWLSPMTQSELDYEQRKSSHNLQNEHRKSSNLADSVDEVEINETSTTTSNSLMEYDRNSQMVWIENEIRRLENLRKLLRKTNSQRKGSSKEKDKNIDLKSSESNRSVEIPIYDSVSNTNIACDMEVILEEFNETITDAHKGTKVSKTRKQETRVLYERPATKKSEDDPGKEIFRRESNSTITKTIGPKVNELQTSSTTGLPGTAQHSTSKNALNVEKSTLTSEHSEDSMPSSSKTQAPVYEHNYYQNDLLNHSSVKAAEENVASSNQIVVVPIQDNIPLATESRPEAETACTKNNGARPKNGVMTTSTQDKRRAKLVTPDSGSTPETVDTLIRERKQTFEEYYRNKKQQFRKELKHRQEELLAKQSNRQHYSKLLDGESNAATCGTYSRQTLTAERTTIGTNATKIVSAMQQASSSCLYALSSDASKCNLVSTSSSIAFVASEVSTPLGTSSSTATQTKDALKISSDQYDHILERAESVHQYTRPVTSEVELRSKRSIAYTLEFDKGRAAIGHIVECPIALAEHLQQAKPGFCARSKERKAILNQMHVLRDKRKQELDELLANTSFRSLERKLVQIPPPVTTQLRLFSTKEMKAITSKRCKNLPEVMAQKDREQEERKRRGHRLMRDLFNQRLQRRVRKGKLSLNHTRAIL